MCRRQQVHLVRHKNLLSSSPCWAMMVTLEYRFRRRVNLLRPLQQLLEHDIQDCVRASRGLVQCTTTTTTSTLSPYYTSRTTTPTTAPTRWTAAMDTVVEAGLTTTTIAWYSPTTTTGRINHHGCVGLWHLSYGLSHLSPRSRKQERWEDAAADGEFLQAINGRQEIGDFTCIERRNTVGNF